jgi:D-alanyl-D-alanine-carboxypeptidase/D-alanyl-D-alanine-endopeptidase
MPLHFASSQSISWSGMPTDSEIRQMLVNRIDRQHQSVGIVVGIIGSEGRRVIAYGHLENGDSRPVNGDTIFEIGSEPKVFTALLLANVLCNATKLEQSPPQTVSEARIDHRSGNAPSTLGPCAQR